MDSWSEYFKRRIELNKGRAPLEVLATPCEDCAVMCGFYAEISSALKKEPIEVQREVSEQWFCHNHPTKACKGNWNNLNLGETNE